MTYSEDEVRRIWAENEQQVQDEMPTRIARHMRRQKRERATRRRWPAWWTYVIGAAIGVTTGLLLGPWFRSLL